MKKIDPSNESWYAYDKGQNIWIIWISERKKKLLSEPKEKRTASQTVAPCLSSINWIYYIGSAKLNINSKWIYKINRDRICFVLYLML